MDIFIVSFNGYLSIFIYIYTYGDVLKWELPTVIIQVMNDHDFALNLF